MSHFVVLVASKTGLEDEIASLLQPYHEYECTGFNDQYVEFVDHHDEVLEGWKTDTDEAWHDADGKVYKWLDDIFYREPTEEEKKKIAPGAASGCGGGIAFSSRDWGDGLGYRPKVHYEPEGLTKFDQPVSERYATIEEYAEQCHGYDECVEGRIGRYTNPNAKWDWWVIGGRWSGLLPIPKGKQPGDFPKGRPGVMGSQHDSKGCDQLQKHEVDYTDELAESRIKYAAEYDKHTALIDGRDWLSWEHCRGQHEAGNITLDEARKMYHDQDVIKDVEGGMEPMERFNFEIEELRLDRDTFIEGKAQKQITPWCILTPEHGWNEKAEMGWWALYDDAEAVGWLDRYKEIWNEIPDDYYITVVDCHI